MTGEEKTPHENEQEQLEQEIGVDELDNTELEDVAGAGNGVCGFGCPSAN